MTPRTPSFWRSQNLRICLSGLAWGFSPTNNAHEKRGASTPGRSLARATLLLLALTHLAQAHIGAPDVYLKTTAGPYHLLVAIHLPATVPGAATIDIRTEDTDITVITIDGTALQRFPQEQIFTCSLWVDTSSAKHMTIHVSGQQGEAEVTISLPGTGSQRTSQPANRFLVWGGALTCLLCFAMLWRRGHRPVVAAALPALALVLIAASFLPIRRPTQALQLSLLPNGRLQLILPGRMDDLVADHGKLMHLFLIREPQMDVLLHLHPTQTAPGRFEVELPSMAPGTFRVFADVVHRDGTLQTFTASAGLPLQTGHILAADDSIGIVPRLARATLGATTVRLMDGYTLSLTLSSPLHPRVGQLLRFSLKDPAGQPPADMQIYLDMPAHAIVLKQDATVFAHIHPDGTLPMSGTMPMMMPASEVSFPFGFPTAGLYRVFVQMKHGTTIETAAFDLTVQ